MGIVLFGLCTWAVFSRRVSDGLLGRHLLVFAAISSAGYAWSGEPCGLYAACMLIIVFLLLYTLRQFIKLAFSSNGATCEK